MIHRPLQDTEIDDFSRDKHSTQRQVSSKVKKLIFFISEGSPSNNIVPRFINFLLKFVDSFPSEAQGVDSLIAVPRFLASKAENSVEPP